MKMRLTIFVTGICMCALVLSTYLFAGITGKIAGRVRDAETGEGLAGANIIVRGIISGGQELTLDYPLGAAADLDGYYYIVNVPPGTYVVEAQMMGYQTVVQNRVRVSVDHTTKVNFELEASVITLDEVVVVARREEIIKDLTASEVSVGAEELAALPVRTVDDVLDLQAGMVRDAAGNLHIRGGRTTEIAYMIDGVQVIDPLNRRSGIEIDNQAIQELQALSGTFNAEYGQALSGVINIVTKRGSDRFTFNFTGYSGDHLSFDDNTYFVMNNASWANYVARRMTNSPTSDLNMEDVFAGYEPSSAEVLQQKKHLQKTPYLDSYNPRNSIDLQGSISGPVPFTNKRLTYFMSARYLDETGFEYGKRLFMPWGFQAPLGDTEHTFPLADNELVALWPWKSISTQSKLFFQLSPSINMSYGLYYSDTEGKSGDSHAFKYVPDGRRNSYTTAQTHIFSLNHTLSSKTFYELKATYFDKDYKSYLYEDPFDYRYMPVKVGDILQFVYDVQNNEDIELTLNAFDFNFFGNDVFRSKNRVKFKSVRFDLTSQVDKWNQVKLGASGRLHDLFNEWYSLQFSEVDYRPIIPGRSSRHFNTYSHKPKEFAAYIQDKIEINDIIINFGLRFDYFDSDGKVLADPSDPQIYDPFNPYHKYKDFDPEVPLDEQTEFTVVEREAFWWKKASAKSQLSPRFGISFPISADAAVHFSYGHFFQNPEFSRLYHNPNFWVEGSGSQSLVGNADLNAERTVMYEVGLQQRVTEALTFNVTGFYRDIRDWIGISSVIASYNARGDYYKYINKDHAVGKGITLASKLRTSHISANLDYTFMTAKGTHSDPVDAWFDIQEGHAPRVELVNLDWDQRHTLNAVVTYQNRGWTASLVSEYRSGLPYTPRFTIAEVAGGSAFIGLRENSSFKPSTFNVDLRLSKRFRYRGLNYDVLLYVYNLFDIRNPKSVFPDTGSPDYTLDTINLVDRNQGTVDIEVSDVSEFNTHAGFYQPPRFIQIGLSVNL